MKERKKDEKKEQEKEERRGIISMGLKGKQCMRN
jgi:hypothetical protein